MIEDKNFMGKHRDTKSAQQKWDEAQSENATLRDRVSEYEKAENDVIELRDDMEYIKQGQLAERYHGFLQEERNINTTLRDELEKAKKERDDNATMKQQYFSALQDSISRLTALQSKLDGAEKDAQEFTEWILSKQSNGDKIEWTIYHNYKYLTIPELYSEYQKSKHG